MKKGKLIDDMVTRARGSKRVVGGNSRHSKRRFEARRDEFREGEAAVSEDSGLVSTMPDVATIVAQAGSEPIARRIVGGLRD